MVHRWRLAILAILTAIIMVVMSAAGTVEIDGSRMWVARVTGSWKQQTRGLFGIESAPVIRTSALEKWLVAREGPIEHDWQFLGDRSKTLLGGARSACAQAPLIYELDLEVFVRDATDEELAAFVKTMRTGTLAQQEVAVDAAIDKVLAQ